MKTRFEQFMGYREAWRQDQRQEDITHGLLASIGYLRRAGIMGENLEKLRECEVEMRRSIDIVLETWGRFMEGSTLPEKAEVLRDEWQDPDRLVDFYQDRDDSELAYQLAREYAAEETAGGKATVRVRSLLNEVDDRVLLLPHVVQALRDVGRLEIACGFDPDFFWWLPAKRGECELPPHRRDHYLAGHIDEQLPSRLAGEFQRHLSFCGGCRKSADNVRGI